MRRLNAGALRAGFAAFLLAGFAPSAIAQQLDAEFRHDRIFLRTRAPDGAPLVWFTDSGGGWNAIAASVAQRYTLTEIGKVELERGEAPLVAFPAFADLPSPFDESWLHGGLVVVPDRELGHDGVLGSRWFADKVWKVDYARHTLERLPSYTPRRRAHTTPLGFRTDASGRRQLHFPRIGVRIDGRPLDLLLDTGATATLTATSAPVFDLPAGSDIGTGFIARSIFEGWVKRHPRWRVIERADDRSGQALRMIEVPRIEVAGLKVGPVWFTERADDTFRQWMSRMTDKPVVGALGGSALRYFRVILDYPAGVADFEVSGKKWRVGRVSTSLRNTLRERLW